MILLLERVDIRNFWQSVTGSMRWDEAPPQAAIREVFEETAISGAGKLVDWHHSARFDILEEFRQRYAPQTHRNLEHMFSLQIAPDHPVVISPEEHIAFEWRHYSEAVEIVWSWSNREAINLLASRYWV